MRSTPGPFVARAEIVSGKSDSALIIFMNDLANMRSPVPPEDLDRARRYLQLGLPAAFETVGDIAAEMAHYALYNLPLDEPTRAVARIGAVTEADVQRAATKYLDPEKFAIVITGDARTLVPMLRALNLAPVELRDPYGNPKP
jgi:zinc protease